jgi:hypothetical protein
MLGFVLLLPMVFISMCMSILTAMLVALSALMSLFMAVFTGGLIVFSTALLTMLIMLFS